MIEDDSRDDGLDIMTMAMTMAIGLQCTDQSLLNSMYLYPCKENYPDS